MLTAIFHRLSPSLTQPHKHPPIGAVGLTEPQATEKYGKEDIGVCTSSPRPPLFTLTDGARTDKSSLRTLYFSMVPEEKEPSVYKLIAARPKEKVVGIHVIGLGSDGVIQGFAVVVKMGATKEDLDNTFTIYSTSVVGALARLLVRVRC